MDIASLVIAKADEESEKGNHQAAFKLFLEGAERNIYECKNRLGICYECGLGVKKNIKKAIYWYRRAIEGDNSLSAMNNLALLYFKRKNQRRAKYWYKKAIKAGDSGEPSLELAKIYLESKSNKHNIKMANHYLAITLKCKPYNTISQDAFDEANRLWQKHFA